jgi:predicted membrane channel-forming protein YqfA (hemolysin III family)
MKMLIDGKLEFANIMPFIVGAVFLVIVVIVLNKKTGPNNPVSPTISLNFYLSILIGFLLAFTVPHLIEYSRFSVLSACFGVRL